MASFRKKSKTKDAPWYFTYTDADGRRREIRGARTKRATEQMARELETKAAMTKAGLVDPKEDRYRGAEIKSLADHLADWRADLMSRGNTTKHADLTRKRVAKILGDREPGRVSDLGLTSSTEPGEASGGQAGHRVGQPLRPGPEDVSPPGCTVTGYAASTP